MPGLTGAQAENAGTDAEPMGGEGGEGLDLATLLEEIDEDMMAELAGEAEEAYLAGTLDEYMDAEGSAPTEDSPPVDEAADGEEVEGDEGEMAGGATATDAAAMVSEIAQMQNEAADIAAAAADSDEGDDAPINAALAVIDEALSEAEEASSDAEKAEGGEDMAGAAAAAATVEGAHAKATAALEQAKIAANGQVNADKAAKDADAPEASPLSMWAERNA